MRIMEKQIPPKRCYRMYQKKGLDSDCWIHLSQKSYISFALYHQTIPTMNKITVEQKDLTDSEKIQTEKEKN